MLYMLYILYICNIYILVNWPWVEVSLDLREDGFVATAPGDGGWSAHGGFAKWRETEDRGWSIGLPVMVYDNPQSIYIYVSKFISISISVSVYIYLSVCLSICLSYPILSIDLSIDIYFYWVV
jgi:hypothetical protein